MVSDLKSDGENFSGVKAIVLDVEGTTTSISFVKDTLFPYVRKNLAEYLEKNLEKDEVKEVVKLMKEQVEKDKEESVEGLIPIEDGENLKESLMKNVLWQMDLDRKTSALKLLQGQIWRDGYASGQLKGHLYPDAAECLRQWANAGRRLYVYSSGSVEAQKLLFANSEAGDLLSVFSGHFDTAIGPKTATDSYTAIAKEIQLQPEDVLFLTDVAKEAESARAAGLHAVLVVREGNAPLSEEILQQYQTVPSFADLVFERCAKRAKTCAEPQPQVIVPGASLSTESPSMEVDSVVAEEVAKEVEPEKQETAEKAKESEQEKPAPEETKEVESAQLKEKELDTAEVEKIAEPEKMEVNALEAKSVTEEVAAMETDTMAAEPVKIEAVEEPEKEPSEESNTEAKSQETTNEKSAGVPETNSASPAIEPMTDSVTEPATEVNNEALAAETTAETKSEESQPEPKTEADNFETKTDEPVQMEVAKPSETNAKIDEKEEGTKTEEVAHEVEKSAPSDDESAKPTEANGLNGTNGTSGEDKENVEADVNGKSESADPDPIPVKKVDDSVEAPPAIEVAVE